MDKKIYFKAKRGDREYNNRILDYLESIGGKHNTDLTGYGYNNGYYYINDSGKISYTITIGEIFDYKLMDIDIVAPINNNSNLRECFEKILKKIELNGTK